MATLAANLNLTRADGIGNFLVYVAPATGTATQATLQTPTTRSNLNIAGFDLSINDLYVIVSDISSANNGSTFTARDSVIEMSTQGTIQVQGEWNVVDCTITIDEGTNSLSWGAFGPAGNTNNPISVISNNRFWGPGGRLRALLNSFPAGTTFENNSFYNGDAVNPLGAFAELGPLNIAGGTFGPFTRTRTEYGVVGAGDSIIRVTGGPDRDNLTFDTNWAIWPGNNYVGLINIPDNLTIDADAGQSIWHVDMVIPAIYLGAGRLALGPGQGVSTTRQARQRNLMSWRPIINGDAAGPRLTWTGFSVHSTPATFDNAIQPVELTANNFQIPGVGFNGFLIEQDDTGIMITTNIAANAAEEVTPYANRTFRLFDYATQVNTLVGQTFTTNFGREIIINGANQGNITTDLTYTNNHIITEVEDTFLNNQPSTYAPTDIVDLTNVYPALKAQAYEDMSSDAERLRVVPSIGGLRYLSNVNYGFTEVLISADGTMNLPLGVAAGFFNQTHDYRNETDVDVDVNWTGTTSISDGGISGGMHSVFPNVVSEMIFSNDPTIVLTGDINIEAWTFTGSFRFTSTAARTATITRQQATQLGLNTNLQDAAGNSQTIGNITYTTPALADATYTFTFADQGFRGIAGLAYRENGLTGTDPWTPIATSTTTHGDPDAPNVHDFTAALGNLGALSGGNIGFTGNNQVFVFTVGAGFSVGLTPVPQSITPAINVDITVTTNTDPNYNSTADLTGLTLTLDVEESATGTGRIDIEISGADTGLTGAQTNRLLGGGRNDVDYLQEIWDGGRIIDYITFPTQETTTVDGSMNVVFSKLNAQTPQQLIAGVSVIGEANISSESADTVTQDVINLPGTTGLSVDAARTALNNAPRLQLIDQQNAYLISDGNVANPQYDRLIGIRPKQADFVPGTDYTPTP